MGTGIASCLCSPRRNEPGVKGQSKPGETKHEQPSLAPPSLDPQTLQDILLPSVPGLGQGGGGLRGWNGCLCKVGADHREAGAVLGPSSFQHRCFSAPPLLVPTAAVPVTKDNVALNDTDVGSHSPGDRGLMGCLPLRRC